MMVNIFILCSFKSETICESYLFSEGLVTLWSLVHLVVLQTQFTNGFKKSYNYEDYMAFTHCYNGNDSLLRIYFIKESSSYQPCNSFSSFGPQRCELNLLLFLC